MRLIHKQAMILMLVLCSLAGIAGRAPAQEERAAQAAVLVRDNTGAASGVFIRRDLVLCNWHGVSDGGVRIQPNGSANTYSATVVATDRQRDLALVRVPAIAPAVLAVAERESGNSSRLIAGFPHRRFTKLRTTVFDRRRYNPTKYALDTECIWLRGSVGGGASGSPVVSDAGEITGIIWGGNEQHTIAISLNSIHAFLRNAGYGSLIGRPPPIVASPGHPPSSSTELGKINRTLRKLADEMHDINNSRLMSRSSQRARMINAMRQAVRELDKIGR